MARKNDKSTMKPQYISKHAKEKRKAIITSVAEKVLESRVDGKHSKYGKFVEILRDAQDVYVWLTRSQVDNEIRRMKNKEPVIIPTDSNLNSAVSGLLSLSCSKSSMGGRPQGTTNEEKKNLDERKKNSINQVTMQYHTLKEAARSNNKPVAYGSLQKLIQKALQEHNLDKDAPDFVIPLETIRSRVKASNMTKSQTGILSPMDPLESLIADVFIQKSRMGQPMGTTNGLLFINSLIADTKYEKIVNQHKVTCGIPLDNNKLVLGKKYLKNFMRRNKEKLEKGGVTNQDNKRKEWSTYQNVEKMYNLVYNGMVEARVAEKLPEPVWMDRSGEIVSKDKAFGQQVSHKVTHPEYLIFVDEVGNNLNMKNDKPIGGQKRFKEKSRKAKVAVSTADAHYTVLGFTSGTGEPIMCAVIFSATEMTSDMQLGVDITAALSFSRL